MYTTGICKATESMIFYTYLWLRDDGTPYYVGKGKGNRAFKTSGRKMGKCPENKDRIIIQYFISEEDALLAEKILFAFYGRKNIETGCLINLTDGGEGTSGAILSAHTRRKMSESRKGEKNPNFGGVSEQHKLNNSIAQKKRFQFVKNPKFGTQLSESTKEKIRGSRLGKKASDATKEKMQIAAKKRAILLGTNHFKLMSKIGHEKLQSARAAEAGQ